MKDLYQAVLLDMLAKGYGATEALDAAEQAVKRYMDFHPERSSLESVRERVEVGTIIEAHARAIIALTGGEV